MTLACAVMSFCTAKIHYVHQICNLLERKLRLNNDGFVMKAAILCVQSKSRSLKPCERMSCIRSKTSASDLAAFDSSAEFKQRQERHWEEGGHTEVTRCTLDARGSALQSGTYLKEKPYQAPQVKWVLEPAQPLWLPLTWENWQFCSFFLDEDFRDGIL